MQILIIDDSATTRGLLKKALVQGCPDCTVREAQDGRSAIHELTQGKVDLIISDLEMPGVDGHRFLETLQGNPLLRKKKVLVFSSAITPELIERHRDNPNVAFLNKPASSDNISKAVQDLLSTVTA
jgi:CheY-like chemotaxis protein